MEMGKIITYLMIKRGPLRGILLASEWYTRTPVPDKVTAGAFAAGPHQTGDGRSKLCCRGLGTCLSKARDLTLIA